jgi:inositol oxygenase
MQLRDYAHADQRVVEFYREQHTKQTVAFVQDKRRQFLPLRHRTMTMWEAVLLLQELQDDSDPDMDRPQIVHAVQTAERLRAVVATGALPDWMIVTGLLHDVGKGVLLSLGEPQYAVVGDTFIVGCQWAPEVVYHELFADNPDTRVPFYQTPFGRYQGSRERGLDGVLMSWGHDEYLYEVVRQYFCSKASALPLPEAALAIFRYHSFYAAHTHGAYAHLMTAHDRAMLEWVRAFSQFDLYSKSDAEPDLSALLPVYERLVNTYFPTPLQW